MVCARNENELNSFEKKFSRIKQLESKYTVKLIDMFSDLENRLFFLVMEFLPNGNLDTFISVNPNLSS